jgi:hypothetical protein
MVIHFFCICKDLAASQRLSGLRKGYAFGTLTHKGNRGEAGWLYDESTTASSAHWKEWG